MASTQSSCFQWLDTSRRQIKALSTRRHGCQGKTAHNIATSIVSTHKELKKLPNLRPGESINRLLGGLVSTCCQIHTQDIITEVLTNPKVQATLPALRLICSEAEGCLEDHWARYIGGACDVVDAHARLKEFPYYQNYIDLTRLELSALYSATSVLPRRIAFIGSGPLPLSSLFILDLIHQWRQEKPGPDDEASAGPAATVLNIDYSSSAIEASSLMTSKLQRGRETDSGIDVDERDDGKVFNGEMNFLNEAAGATDLTTYDTVFLAALVGTTQLEKEKLILQVVSKMKSGSSLLVRTSWGLRTCLYPEIDLTTKALSAKIRVCSIVHPYSDVVNSVIIAQVR